MMTTLSMYGAPYPNRSHVYVSALLVCAYAPVVVNISSLCSREPEDDGVVQTLPSKEVKIIWRPALFLVAWEIRTAIAANEPEFGRQVTTELTEIQEYTPLVVYVIQNGGHRDPTRVYFFSIKEITMIHRNDAGRWAMGLVMVCVLASVPVWADATVEQLSFRTGKTPIDMRITAIDVQPDGVSVQTTNQADGSVRLAVQGDTGAGGTVTLTISPADRLAYVQGENTITRGIPTDGVLSLRTTAVVCQQRATQQGLQLAIQSGTLNEPITVKSAGKAAVVTIPYQSQSITLLVSGMTGDASISLEDRPVFAGKTRTVKAVPLAGAPAAVATEAGTQPAKADADATHDPTPAVGEWQWFSGKRRAFAPMLADPEETVTHLGYMIDENSSKLGDFGIGGDIVVLDIQPNEESLLTFSIRGLITGRLDWSLDSNPVVDSDYIGGLAVGYETGPWEFEAYFYHESSHLGDEMITEHNMRRIDYSKEVLRVLAARRFLDDSLRVYGGVSFIVNGTPDALDATFEFQVGGEYTFDLWGVPMFAAVDLQTQQANDWYLNTNAQYGIFLNRSVNRPRIYLEFYHGYSNMGQFWNQKETHGMIGFGYDF